MFSRNSFFRQSGRTGDPLTGGAGEATEAEVVGALNRLELAADDDASSRASGSHARLRDMGTEKRAPGKGSSAGFPSTGFSRSRRATPAARSVSVASDKAAADAMHATPETAQPTEDTAEPTRDTPDATEDTADAAALLPAGSLGRRLWQHVQASPSASEVRAMLADSDPRALLLLPQTPSSAADLSLALDDHLLFTERAADAGSVTKFATSSGIHGRITGRHVQALGVLPLMEQLMQRVGRTDAPRTTLFDVLEGEEGAAEEGRAVELRVARWAQLALPDGRKVPVAVTGGRLDRGLVADWSVTGLSAHVQASLDRTLASLVPSAPAASSIPAVGVALEKIMHMVSEATADQQTADAWQTLAAELYDTLAHMLDALEDESSVCGDAEQRRRMCAELMDAVEKPVVDAVYLRVFAPPADRLADEQFDRRAEALRLGGLTPGLLGVGDKDAGGSRELVRACVLAGERLAEMDGVHAPLEKLQRVVDAHRVLVAHIDSASASLSADSLLPLMIYSVARMPRVQLVSNLRFVQRWRMRALLAAHMDYCLTNALAAVEYVANGDGALAKADGSLGPRVPALRALHGFLGGNVGIEVVQGVADGGRKVAAGVYDATVGRLFDSAGQNIFRAPWRVLPLAMQGGGGSGAREQEMQDALRRPEESDQGPKDEAAVVRLPRATLRNAPRPAVIERFLGMQPGDLTLNDVSQLLSSYKELASFVDK